MKTIPTYAKAPFAPTWHFNNRGAADDRPRTLCGRSTVGWAKFNTRDLPSGERTAPVCKRCRKGAGLDV